MNPTPLGEGKTVIAIGLAMALNRLGRTAIATLRQPSLGPLFGVKGGGAGGGRAHLAPADDINLHFTGDLHAVTAATNLLAALVDNHAFRGASPPIAASTIVCRRALDVCDRSLRRVAHGFDLTAASELMAILALAVDLEDLRRRVGRMVVSAAPGSAPVTVEQLGYAGAVTALLKDALRPNLVQTCEGTPALVHTGPFANIAHGNSSVIADLAALRLADFVVTESGFGADCGAEKLFDIKCRNADLRPAAMVIVASIRALKFHSGRFELSPTGPLPPELIEHNVDAVVAGLPNLLAHLKIVSRFGVPAVVALNRFPGDSADEIAVVRSAVMTAGASGFAVSDAFVRGGAGAEELAGEVISACELPNRFNFLYPSDLSIEEKLRRIAVEIYGAGEVDFSEPAREQLSRLRSLGYDGSSVCVAKTQYSLSHDPRLLGRPTGFRFPVGELRLAAGAGFVTALAGEIRTMPGLPAKPAALEIDIEADGRIRGLR